MGEITTTDNQVLQFTTVRSVSLSELPQRTLLRAVTEQPHLMSTSGRIEVLLAHYFIERRDQASYDLILEDWVDILSQLPFWVVDYACTRWTREDRRKPTPHDIYSLASDELLRYRDELNRRHEASIASPEPVELTDAEKAHRAKVSEAVMKSFPKATASNLAPKMNHWADGISIEEQNDRMREMRKAYGVGCSDV